MKSSFLIYCLLWCFAATSQNCLHENLSKSFDFKTHLKRINRGDKLMDTCIVTVKIIKKETKKTIQMIHFGSGWLFDDAYNKCSDVRSYITGYNKKAMVQDSDFGSIIVADFNFDGKEDFALKNDSGGNSGPTYSFYLQNQKGKFIKDIFLSEEMEFFPCIINKKNKTLTTIVFLDATQNSKMIYQYSLKKKIWKRIEHTFLPIH